VFELDDIGGDSRSRDLVDVEPRDDRPVPPIRRDQREAENQAARNTVAAVRHNAGCEPAVKRRGSRDGADCTQGQRSLKRCSGKDFQHEVFVPATTAAFHDEAVAARVLLQE